jgi:magnesium chelatase subunit D
LPSPGPALDLPATIGRASLRQAGEGRTLALAPDDLRWAIPRVPPPVDRCLLLDASASMAGGRWRAAAALADGLLRRGAGRVAAAAFQGRGGTVLCGFTRSRQRLRDALAHVRHGGLTPLAAGLLLGLELAREGQRSDRGRRRRVQIILLTDAEPTSGFWSCDSLADALRAAGQYREARVALLCCGVAANERVLSGLARASGGRCHLLADFSAGALRVFSRQLGGRIYPQPAEGRADTGGPGARPG